MRRGTIFLGLFVVIAAGIIGVSLFLQNQPPLNITIAVSPLAETWLRDSVQDFNASSPTLSNQRRIEVDLIVVEDLDVWGSRRDIDWTPEDHPEGWLPALSTSVNYAANFNFPFEIVTPSTARTPIIWGGYESRVNALTNEGAQPFDWGQVIAVASNNDGNWADNGGEANWRFLKLAFAQPHTTVNGLGVMYSAAASIAQTTDVTRDDVRTDFIDTIEPVFDAVPSNAGGGNVTSLMARGPSTVEIGIAPEVQWLNNLSGLVSNEAMRFSYPQYPVVLDFPLAAWNGANITADERAAVETFGNWLLGGARQRELPGYGLRPADGTPAATDTLFADAEQYGILLDPALDNPVTPPDATATQSMLSQLSR